MLKSVVQTFAVGAERSGEDVEHVELGGSAYRLPGEGKAERLLARASIAALARLGLAQPARPSLEYAPPIAELLAADKPPIGRRSSELLERWLVADDFALVEDALRVIGDHRRRLDLSTLPLLLDRLGNAQRRGWLRAVACVGSEWLARQNPDWSWALATETDPDAAFETGIANVRVAALREMRARSPDAALARLAERFQENDADERAALLGGLAVGLQPADEPFLERCLDDRAKSVRLAAAELLGRLPDSAFAARARARLQPLFEVERGLLRKALRVQLPTPPDKAEERDGVDGKGAIPGLHNAGPRQLQLAQRLAQVPVSTVAAQLGLEPAALVERFREQEFAAPLLAGLCLSASRNPEPSALRALATLADQSASAQLYQQWILPALPTMPDYADFVLKRLQQDVLDLSLLDALPAPWPAEVSRLVLQWARHKNRRGELAKDYSHYGYAGVLALAAIRVAPQAAALSDWPDFTFENASNSQRRAAEAIDGFLNTVRQRIEFLSSLEMP
jgi:hypothetical protein